MFKVLVGRVRAHRALAAALVIAPAALLAAAPRASADLASDPHCNLSEGAINSACLRLPYRGYGGGAVPLRGRRL